MTRQKRSGAVPVAGMAALALVLTVSAFSHCDTMDGPVVKDAQVALVKGEVDGVLKWAPQADEEQIRRAFDRTLLVRAMGPEAKELADMYFFETLVRLHRAAEGAPYVGIKPAGTPMPAAVARSDEALEKGSVDDLAKRIAGVVEAGIRERFAAAVEASKHKNRSVEAGRRFVAAYVEFVHYVEGVHDVATGHGAHHGHQAATEKDQPPAKAVEPAPRHEH